MRQSMSSGMFGFSRPARRRAVLLCGALAAGCAAAFPLEWNPTYDVSVPREVEVQPVKLLRDGIMKEGDGFKVFADGQALATTALEGKAPGSVRLRFSVPAGTKTLTCEPCADGAKAGGCAEAANLFAGAVSSPGRWTFDGGKVEPAGGNLLLRGGSATAFATCDAEVPAGLAGKAVVQEIVATSRARLVWSGVIKVVQLDENGAELPETLCDIRWTSHLRPPGKTVRYVDEGRIHPRARRLRAWFELRPVSSSYDDYGRAISDPAIKMPSLEVSKLEVRAAASLPFPKWSDNFFVPGASGRDGDFALRSGGPDRIGFFHQATTRAGWTQGHQFRRERDRALPSGDGTVEAWFMPDGAPSRSVPLFQLHQGIRTRMLAKRGLGEMLGLRLNPASGTLTFAIKDWKGHSFKGSANGVAMPAGKWTHVAVAWRCGGAADVFVGGRRVLSVPIPEFEAVPLADKSQKEVNDLWAQQLFVGCLFDAVRGRDGFADAKSEMFFDGAIDAVRTSSSVRYTGDFSPAASLSLDADARSLFGFDRTFDGECGGGFGVVKASIFSRRDRVEHRLCGKWYYPEELLPENDPRKVLDILNYPVMPRADEYLASRRGETASFDVKAGDLISVNSPDGLYMDYVEIANVSPSEPLLYPIVVRRGALDPRSFGDLRDSLGEFATTDREKANRVFQYVISASDYFMNHQADFPAGSDSPVQATYAAMLMLNSYCGFECGPLNNLALNMLAAVAGCPSAPTGGYGHAFEQVFFDGKNHIYDLSAQKFFPSFDNETSVYLGEAGDMPGVFNRVGGSCGHFIRMGSRAFGVCNPGFCEKAAVILNPGERFRVWTGNDGQFNNLKKWHATGTYYPMKELNPKHEQLDYAEVAGAKKNFKWVMRCDRVFPHYSTGAIVFDGRPSRENPAFARVDGNSFCYVVRCPYPIVLGVYEARLADGSGAAIELSTDGGETFSPVPMNAGRTMLQYRVKARHAYLVRVKAPVDSVARFSARTECEVNPRTYPGWLKGGGDKLRFKAESAAPARVTFGWSLAAKPIVVKGGVYSGTLPGYERQLVVVKPGEASCFDVEGASAAARVVAHGPVRAALKGGRLEIAADAKAELLIARGDDLPEKGSSDTAFGAVEIVDGDARKVLTVLVSPCARLITADKAEPLGSATMLEADPGSVNGRIMFRNAGDGARIACDHLPGGKYVVLPLLRYGGHEATASAVYMRHAKSKGNGWRVGGYISGCFDYLKANYSRPGARARWKWDTSARTDIQAVYNGWMFRTFDLSGIDTLEFHVKDAPGSGVELAAVLLVPDPDMELRLDMRKMLFGLNCDPVKVGWAPEHGK